MQKILWPLAALLVLAADLDAQRRRGRGRRDRQLREIELKNFEFKPSTFESKALDRGEASYGIYLPKGWDAKPKGDGDAKKTYPWAIWLHGFGGYGSFHGEGGAQTLDTLRGKGEIPDMIIVALQAPGGRSAYINGERAGDIEDAIVKDLVAHMEKKWPVKKGREHRAIMGVSMGGMAALKIGFKHHKMFGTVAAHSSPVLPDSPDDLSRRIQGMVRFMGLSEHFGDPIDKEKWQAEMPMGQARSQKLEDLSTMHIYFDAGTADRYGFAPGNEDLSALLEKRGIDHTFRLVEGGGHAWGSPSMKKNAAVSLKFVGDALSGKLAEAKKAKATAKPAASGDGDNAGK